MCIITTNDRSEYFSDLANLIYLFNLIKEINFNIQYDKVRYILFTDKNQKRMLNKARYSYTRHAFIEKPMDYG